MAVPTPNLNKVLVGTGFMWTAPAPLRVPEPLVADNVDFGGDWVGNWVYIGGTVGGVELKNAKKSVDINIEEQSSPVDTKIDTQTVTFSAQLSEETIANIKLALGGGTATVTAPGISNVGKTRLALSDTMDFLSVGVDVLNDFGFWTRWYVPLVKSVGSLDVKFLRAKSQRVYTLDLASICATSAISVTEMTAPHS